MKYLSAITIITAILISSCKTNDQNSETYLNIRYNNIEEKFGPCDGNGECGEIEIEYPIFSENNKTIDDKLNLYVTSSINSFYNVKSVEQTPQKFISDYKDFVNDFPESANNKWNVSMHYKIVNNTKKVLSLAFHMEGYTGGAHGFRTLSYTNYNPNSGEKLQLKDVITDVDKLRIIARNTFIEENDLDTEQSLNTQGFWFKDDIFSLNENFLITPDGIKFHYNQYEIAPYADGPITIDISINKLEGILK